jgi:3-oxoacyl-(acyl-carrier-protein) synthase
MRHQPENDDPKHPDRWTKTEMDLYFGEGADALILEEYEHAVARGAKYIVKLVEVECLLMPIT